MSDPPPEGRHANRPSVPDPAYSVVVPTRNTRQLTTACLATLCAAEAVDGTVEIVLVDDAGTDGTAEEVRRRFPTVRVLENPRQLGFTGSANRGLDVASGRLLLLLNSDTEVEPSLWLDLETAFEARPRLGVAGARLHYPDGKAQWSGGKVPSATWLFAAASGIPTLFGHLPGLRRLRPVAGSGGGEVDWVTGAAMAFSRHLWERVGPFDERFWLYCQDLDFCCRVRDAGHKVAVVPEFRVLHHHGGTVSRNRRSTGTSHPELMWPELVRWAAKRGGAERARRAAWALRAGTRLRLAGYRLAGHQAAAAPYRLALTALDEEMRSPGSASTPGSGSLQGDP